MSWPVRAVFRMCRYSTAWMMLMKPDATLKYLMLWRRHTRHMIWIIPSRKSSDLTSLPTLLSKTWMLSKVPIGRWTPPSLTTTATKMYALLPVMTFCPENKMRRLIRPTMRIRHTLSSVCLIRSLTTTSAMVSVCWCLTIPVIMIAKHLLVTS